MAPGGLFEILTGAARDEGFPLAGALDLESIDLGPHVARYDEWLKRGYAGAMEYLVRGRDRRADPRVVFPEARSILCVAVPYPRGHAGQADPSRGPRYARYLQGSDYHKELSARLERTLERAATSCRDAGLPVPRWKVCVDTSAVLERSFAALAGLGWIGKNTLLIHPKHGSYLFLAEALLDQPVGRGPQPMADYCGNCRRCLDACPTKALVEPHWLDSNRCISYWTLEKRGKLEIPEDDRRKMGTWVAGCDLCQESCPFNFKPVREEPRPGLAPHAASLDEWEALLDETEEQYRIRVKGSALSRVKPAQFRRNLAIALTNAALDHELSARLKAKVRKSLEAESDATTRAEWERCLAVLDDEST